MIAALMFGEFCYGVNYILSEEFSAESDEESGFVQLVVAAVAEDLFCFLECVEFVGVDVFRFH